VALNGFKSAYAIKDGAEGPRGWLVCVPFPLIPQCVLLQQILSIRLIYICHYISGLQNSSLPWIEPKKTLSLDLSSLTDSISGVFGVSIQFYIHLI
jgi:chitinase domain-containing protein 1